MRFHVPQFIDIEDKMFGPLTFKQFVYVVGGAGLSYIIFRFTPLYIAVVLIALVVALSGALAFYKVNNKPFVEMIRAAILYFSRSRLYLWKKQPRDSKKDPKKQRTKEEYKSLSMPRISESKLRDITWNLEVEDTTSQKNKDTQGS